VELGELVIEAKKGIHDLGKEKHERWVDVERIDRMLKEIEEIQENETEYRQVKDLKIKIIHYFKKLQSQRMEEEQLDLELQKATEKDANMATQLDHFSRLAVEQSL
jgi:tRNA-dihydrouridine synthase